MRLNPIGRIVSLAVAGTLAVGALAGTAACGGSTKKETATPDAAASSPAAAGSAAGSPSPAVSLAPPDKESCNTATALAQLVSVRVTGAKLNLETQFGYAADSIRDAWKQIEQAKTKVTAAQVKAIVEEYQAGLQPLKTQIDGSSVNKTKLLADLNVVSLKFDKVAQQLSIVCAESPEAAAAAVNARAATCTKVEEAGLKLFGPYVEVGTAGNDQAKLKVAVANLKAALDGFVADLNKIYGETNDNDLKAAIGATVKDAQKMGMAVIEFGTDPAKLQSILSSETFNTGQAMLEKVCAG